MNTNEITIGKLKELSRLFNGVKPSGGMLKNYIGKYVIVRSQNEGVNAGIVKDIDETGVVLTESRRLWYHKPKESHVSWYEGIACFGISEDSKVSNKIEKVIVENYSLTICSELAQKTISEAVTNEQNS